MSQFSKLFSPPWESREPSTRVFCGTANATTQSEICGTVNLWRSFYLTTVSHDSNVKLYKTRVVLTVYQFSVLKIPSFKKKKAELFQCVQFGDGREF